MGLISLEPEIGSPNSELMRATDTIQAQWPVDQAPVPISTINSKWNFIISVESQDAYQLTAPSNVIRNPIEGVRVLE